MTRQEFINDVNDFAELIDFCNDVGCSICEDLVYYDAISDYIWDVIRDWDSGWEELRDALGNIDTTPYWYRHEGWLDFYGVDDEFDDYKREVLEEADEYNYFDDEDEDDDDDAWYSHDHEERDDEIAMPSMDFQSVFTDGQSGYHAIVLERQRSQQAFDASLKSAVEVITGNTRRADVLDIGTR